MTNHLYLLIIIPKLRVPICTILCGSDVEAEGEAEAEAVGSGLFQRKRKGSFQIFASLPEAEAVFGLTEITMQITDELRMPLHWSTEGGTIFS